MALILGGCSAAGGPDSGSSGDSSTDSSTDSSSDGNLNVDGDIGAGGGGSNVDPCESDAPPDYCILNYETAGPGCGDGKVNQAAEECDDGNGFPGDGCNGACLTETNWDCTSGTCIQTIVCGDGMREGYEVCDDGGTEPSDGCSSDCLSVDPFYLCPVAGGACVSTVECNDGRISGNEQCEDGNTAPLDGCDASCRLEAGYFCPSIGQSCKKVPFCGDGLQGGNEECDDKNSNSSDGCSSTCLVEGGFACPTPGSACVPIVINCGDGALAGNEKCDDGNTDNGDGCSKTCTVETGFSCPTVGARCNAICGDGLLKSGESCDDGATSNNDGCSSKCVWEPGYFCSATVPHNCVTDTCGNSKTGNGESCDDGNRVPGDGCGVNCRAEPTCTYGSAGCTSKCGDGLVIGEQCDDGNVRSGDGCSSTCTKENGFSCAQPTTCAEKLPWDHDNNDATAGVPTCVDRVPVIYRDFNASHAHFQPGWDSAGTPGLVASSLDSSGKPLWSGASDGVINSGNSALFANWYRDSSASTTVVGELILWDRDRVPTDGAYASSQNSSGLSFVNRWGSQGEKWFVLVGASGPRYEWCSNSAADGCTGKGNCADNKWTVCHAPCTPWSNSSACAEYPAVSAGTRTEWDGSPVFFPLDGKGKTPVGEYSTAAIAPSYGGNWDAESNYVTGAGAHNFHFTSEVRRWFKYDSSKTYKLDFTGDDDVWVFINGKLAVDLGGWHPPLNGSVTVNAGSASTYNLTNGKVYEIVVFQAERKTTGSSYRLTLSGFNSNASICTSTCGDGIVASNEQCDDGSNTGGYGKCQPGCLLGARCGDGTKNGSEGCDNGANLNGYNDGSANACAPGCKKPARCGDSTVDYTFGEICDQGGANSSSYGGCNSCQLGPHCGDGTKNGSEQCDDGVNDGTAGCGPGCLNTSACGNGQLDPGEECDDGINDGGYGECGPSCRNGARCGDNITQTLYEQCDDGVNDGGYGECGPQCRLGQYCGDGKVNGNEVCDDGVNAGGYGQCGPTCKLGPYCGDKKVQKPETCDDGNRTNKDGCSSTCAIESIVK